MVDAPSGYNAGRGALNKLGAIVSTAHLMMKFPTSAGIGFEKGDKKVARDCYSVSLRGAPQVISVEREWLEPQLRDDNPPVAS